VGVLVIFSYLFHQNFIILYRRSKQSKAMQACNFARDKPVSTEFFLFDERDWFYISLSFLGKTLENHA
jgi:hypothetical protein